MKLIYKKSVVAFASLIVALPLGLRASAECGSFHPPKLSNNSWQLRATHPSLLSAALIIDDDHDRDDQKEPSMVGLWKEKWISEGSDGIPNGAEIDAGYSQWHSDGTEINLSAMRPPATGDVCLGIWEKVGPRSYKLNHVGISFDPSGLNRVGPAFIRQTLTLNAKGDEISGTFTIDQYDDSGNKLVHIQGKIIGTRFTMSTNYQAVE